MPLAHRGPFEPDGDRANDLRRFYAILEDLKGRLVGSRRLCECSARMHWPVRGVYFFTESGEVRSDSGSGPRVVRVGTHALKTGARSTLWGRLSQHRGVSRTGGGNHRGSIFRLIVGTALAVREQLDFPTWGEGSSAPKAVREREIELERAVSQVLGEMRLLWIPIEDEPSPDSDRGYIERHAIRLLSNYAGQPLDPPSAAWLGRFCDRERVRRSGLWNSNHVEEPYEPAFLDRLERIVAAVKPVR